MLDQALNAAALSNTGGRVPAAQDLCTGVSVEFSDTGKAFPNDLLMQRLEVRVFCQNVQVGTESQKDLKIHMIQQIKHMLLGDYRRQIMALMENMYRVGCKIDDFQTSSIHRECMDRLHEISRDMGKVL